MRIEGFGRVDQRLDPLSRRFESCLSLNTNSKNNKKMKKINSLDAIISGIASLLTPRRYPVYQPNDLLDSEEASVVLHCTPDALDKYCSDKGLPFSKAGTSRLFLYSDIIAWVKSRDCTHDLSKIEEAAQSRRREKSIEYILHNSKVRKPKV